MTSWPITAAVAQPSRVSELLELTGQQLARLGLGTAPEKSTLRKLFARLDSDALDRVLVAWLWTRTSSVDGRRVIAIDGKAVRGAQDSQGRMPHLVAALDHDSGTVLGQLAVAEKSNEIPCVRELLGCFDLTDAVITVDAMHTQTDRHRDSGHECGRGLRLHGQGQHRDSAAEAQGVAVEGRARPLGDRDRPRQTREAHYQSRHHPAWVGFPGASQAAQLRRTATTKGKKSVEVICMITFADPASAPPAALAAWIQNHWAIENRLHCVRDVAFDEDRSQVRTGQAPRVMATVGNTAISLLRLSDWENIAKALRHHARDPDRALTCLLTC